MLDSDSFTLQDLIDFKYKRPKADISPGAKLNPHFVNTSEYQAKKQVANKQAAKELDELMRLIDEDKFSTKSIHGSSEGQDEEHLFSKLNNMKPSTLLESIHLGGIEHSKVQNNMVNRFSPARNLQQSEIMALKREQERQARRPVYLNLMIIGRKSAGKSSFIKMLLNYVCPGLQ